MHKSAKFHALHKPAVRRRAAILAAGLGASAALGTGVALAADQAQSNLVTAVSATAAVDAVKAQAGGQQKIAEEQAKAAKDRADAEAKKRNEEKAAADRSARAAAPAAAPAAAWVKPVDSYTLGSTFGLAGGMWSNKHSGQDLVVPTGTSVSAVHGGTVVEAGWGGAYGNNIVIKHDDRTFTQYAHLSKINVKVGQKVNTDQEIGLSGSTGNSTGPHLHFETRTTAKYGSGVEPRAFLASKGVKL
ncbi:M23 family metallopeptidase [Streptomyces sp. URMC 123]|uniref:M23 family metallopeptidase n=1 Tax=Streptomyces sp. URMC 123 TaxID=3423403 RepID=UPI003F1C959B